MPSNWNRIAPRISTAAVVLIAFFPVCAFAAQNPAVQPPPRPDDEIFRTIYLHHVIGRDDFIDLTTALRSTLRRSMFYGDQSQQAIVFRGTPEDFETAQKIAQELDRPRPAYRLTYTFTDISGGKPGAPQKFTFAVLAGQKVTFKQGDRVPILTAAPDTAKTANSSQVTYVDVGVNITATLNASADSLVLESQVQESAVAQESVHAQEPIIHQTVLNSSTTLSPGKPQLLGSLDLPGTPQHEQVEVTAEALRR